ncbi:MAG: hypothetical protein ABI193_12480 [Minicystis sp.]
MHPSRSPSRLCRAGLLSAGSLAAALAAPLPCRAAEPPKEVTETEVLAPDAGTPRAAASDDRTGHLLIYPRFSYTGAAGYLASLSPVAAITTSTFTRDVVGAGMSFGGAIGVGIARHASLQIDGSYTLFGTPSGCDNCKGSSSDLGLGLAYHLAQGIAVDPWGSFGMGVRSQRYTILRDLSLPRSSTDVLDQAYVGLDFARIALGADFYPLPYLGLGPYFEADVGTNLSRPDPTFGASAYAFFQVGVRIAVDPFRRASGPVQTQALSASFRPVTGF